ncbi:MAG TPA: Gfo/Idh/MocA family oxidoreductase, partial [Tepidisphaeraceae bacterium]|nr:Gfo/Idh/MocA family oxidoreductase [Tepidisphaeraceae bacterium]
MSNQEGTLQFTRRRFLQTSSLLAAGAAVAQFPFVHVAHAASDIEIKIGLIGCGGRGTGAVLNAMGAATKVIYPSAGYHTEDAAANAKIERSNIKVVALADLFEDRLEACKGQLAKVGCNIPKERCFVGFDAYKQLLASADVNYAILATPPHFRPMHLKAAIEAGKHVFMEKPVAVDVPGVKMVMEAGALATQKGLGIAAGTQRRHQKSYIETIKRLRDG